MGGGGQFSEYTSASTPHTRKYEPRRIREDDSRMHLIANMNRLRRVDSCPLAGPEVNFRSGFFDPLLSADEDWIKHWEDLEGVECLDCAQGGKTQITEFKGSGEDPGQRLVVPTINVRKIPMTTGYETV
jgi:hypothetical protein